MKIDFEEFKIFCVTPSSPDSNKANSYVKAIQIILNYLNIDSEHFSSHDYEKVQELSKSLSNKNSANYIKLHDFVSSRKQVSYLEGGFISAAINYFKKYYTSKEQNMDSKIEPKERSTHENLTTRYINSLLAKPFVILTGNSGTGKTRIATKFAEYMKQDDSLSNSLLVPVGADWTDNTKILGYYNPTNYYDSKTDEFFYDMDIRLNELMMSNDIIYLDLYEVIKSNRYKDSDKHVLNIRGFKKIANLIEYYLE